MRRRFRTENSPRLKLFRCCYLTMGALGLLSLALATPASAAGPTLTVTPHLHLHNGQIVKVAFSGLQPHTTAAVAECTHPVHGLGAAFRYCDIGRFVGIQDTGNGSGSLQFTVHTGQIGSGTCGPKHTCYINLGSEPIELNAPIQFK